MAENAIIQFENYVHTKMIPLITVSEIITIYYFEFNSTHAGPMEQHEMWEFIYLRSGMGYQTIEDKDYLMKEGDYFFISPNVPHRFYSHPESNPHVFVTTFMCNSNAIEAFCGHSGRLPEHLYSYIANIINETDSTALFFQQYYKLPPQQDLLPDNANSPGHHQMTHLYLEQFLIQLYRTLDVCKNAENALPATSKDKSRNELVNQALAYIRDNSYSPITAASVCAHLGYSNSYLSALFAKYWDCSITEYIHRIKIERAMALIRRGATNFSEIASVLCYSDVHYFSRVFRRITDMSPSEYRKTILP